MAIGQGIDAFERWAGARLRSRFQTCELLARLIPDPLVALVVAWLVVGRALQRKKTGSRVIGVGAYELGRVGVAAQKICVVAAVTHQHMSQRQQQRAVGARTDGNPLVGNGTVAGANRVHRDEASARALEPGERGFHRVAVMVLGCAQHDQQARVIKIGATKLPERAADGVHHSGGHVDRAKTAVGGVVGRAKLACKQAGQGLHLIAAGEEGKLFWVGLTKTTQPLLQTGQGLFPADRFKFAATALCAGFATQGLGQPRRRILLHDAGATLGADHALIQRMVRIALDKANHTVPQMHADATTAGAHVTGGGLDLGRRFGFAGWLHRDAPLGRTGGKREDT